MGGYFGTDGIRGTYGDACVNPGFAFRFGAALGKWLQTKRPGMPLNAVIGRDTRASGPELVDALVSGLNGQDVYIHDLGVVPTPAVAQSLLGQHADCGISVTASHNPAEDNGFKLFGREGVKLAEAEEREIEGWVAGEPEAPAVVPAGKSFPLDAAAFYINYLRSLMDQDCMRGWRIVLDTAHGAAWKTSPAVFGRWGAEIFQIGGAPDGANINDGVGSEHPESLCEAVRSHQAHIGIAHDGDGDRLVVCDENGVPVPGDTILGLFGVYALRSDALRGKRLVATVQSNMGLDAAVRAEGGAVERVDVGDRNVALRMREIGSNIGGESSGHIILGDFATTGDGLLAAVKLIDLMCRTRKPLSELRKEVPLFPQASVAVRTHAKPPLEELARLREARAAAEKELGEEGRVFLRYSGTEPKLRLLVEGREESRVNRILKKLEKAARSDLNQMPGES